MKIKNDRFYSLGFTLFFVISVFISKCNLPIDKDKRFPYVIYKPDNKYVLQHKLTEVSGLSFISDREVALIEDESGSVFIYDLGKNVVERKITFDKKGDYEDVEMVGDTAYVLRSDGKIFELENISGSRSQLKENKYNTSLSRQNNTEGLCYDNKSKLLLIACKDKPGIGKTGKKYENKKAIYSFNTETKTFSDTPYVLIDINEVQKTARGVHTNAIRKLIRFYTDNRESHDFEPSGLSIQPLTGDLYIISSVGKLLVIVSPEGKLLNVIKLPPSIFKQPEGIAFDSIGNMYISNEGRNGKGNILRFNYVKDQSFTL